MGSTKSTWRNNILTFFDGATHERVLPVAPLVFKDDFVGAVNANWTLDDIHAQATEAKIANQHGGVFGLATGAADAEQEAAMQYTDQLEWSSTKGFIAEFVVQHFVVPTETTEVYFGMTNAYVKGRLHGADEGPTIHAVFMCLTGGAISIFTDNDAGIDNPEVATGVTVVTGAYHLYRIDFTTITDVKFYIDGVGVATGTTFDLTGAGNLQPLLAVYKASGTGLGTLYLDEVKIWSPR